jgi:hypothetical protein
MAWIRKLEGKMQAVSINLTYFGTSIPIIIIHYGNTKVTAALSDLNPGQDAIPRNSVPIGQIGRHSCMEALR